MRKLFIALGMLLVGLIALIMFVNWQHEQSISATLTQGDAEITFYESSHSFGDINSDGGTAQYSFEFSNTGTSPLVITNISTWCDCVTGDYPEHPIMPGKKAKIKVSYDPKGKEGDFTQVLTIISNARHSHSQLIISGNVKRNTDE